MPSPDVKVIISGIDKLSGILGKPLKALNKLGKKMTQTGRMLTLGLSLPILLFGAQTLKTAGSYERSMNRVQNLTGATGKQFTALQKKARLLGAETAFSASETAEAMGVLGLAGFETEQILGSIGSVLNIAGAGMIEMKEAADVLTGVMAGYNVETSEANRMADLLVAAMQASKTDILGVGEAMSFVAPAAADLGVTVKDTALAIGLLSNANIKGARAGTTFRAILAGLAKPTAEGAKTLERLKIPYAEIFDKQGKFTSLTRVIEAFRKSGGGTADMISIFGRRMGVGMSAMVSQGTEKLNKLNKELTEVDGKAKKAADVSLKGLYGQLKILKSTFEEMQIAIGDSGLLEFAGKLIIKVTSFIRVISKLNPNTLKTIAIIAGLVAAIPPLIAVLGISMLVISNLAGALAGLTLILKGVSIALAFLAANPIVLIIAGIVALSVGIYLLVKHWDFFVKVFKKGWRVALDYAKIGFKFLLKFTGPFGIALLGIIENIDLIVGGFKSLGRLVLPKWLEQKMGLTEEKVSPPGGEVLSRVRNVQNAKSEFSGTLRIANAGVKSEIEVQKGDINIEMDSGLQTAGVAF